MKNETRELIHKQGAIYHHIKQNRLTIERLLDDARRLESRNAQLEIERAAINKQLQDAADSEIAPVVEPTFFTAYAELERQCGCALKTPHRLIDETHSTFEIASPMGDYPGDEDLAARKLEAKEIY